MVPVSPPSAPSDPPPPVTLQPERTIAAAPMRLAVTAIFLDRVVNNFIVSSVITCWVVHGFHPPPQRDGTSNRWIEEELDREIGFTRRDVTSDRLKQPRLVCDHSPAHTTLEPRAPRARTCCTLMASAAAASSIASSAKG